MKRVLKLSAFNRKALLTLHIVVSVGLLGDSAGYLAIALHGAGAANPSTAMASYRILQMLAFVFGIPLSFAALLTGVFLGLGTKWGVFRYPWVVTKLILIVSVMAVGGFVLKGAMDTAIAGDGGAAGRLVAGSAYDVAALATATALGVFKPGRRWRRARTATRRAAGPDDSSTS